MTIVTLIAEGRRDESLAVLRSRLDGYNLLPRVRSLAPVSDLAVELSLSGIEVATVREVVGTIERADVIVQEEHTRPPKLLVADMDSTMIGQECIDELADMVGKKEEVAAITERAMRGELDFADALRERLSVLAGLDVSVTDRLLEERIRPNPGAKELIAGLKAAGTRCVLVSGGFTHFAEPVGRMLGFDRVVANVLAVRDGKLTGDVEGDIVDAATKRHILIEEAGDERARTVAIGDGANDLKMMDVAGLGIAYRAKPKVAEAADARLDHAPLDALLLALTR